MAALGFAFDIYELLMAQQILPDVIPQLTGAKPGTPEFNIWRDRLFFLPALVGGAFGLVGGYLTDRFGRRQVLFYSILLYAFSAFATGFVTTIEALLVLRCLTLIGVCVEFVAAVAWIAELFPNARQRETVLGYTQAFSSFGGFMVAFAYWAAAKYGAMLPAISPIYWGDGPVLGDGVQEAWRYTLISGVIPALPLIVIRPFLPESPAWQQKRDAGTLRRPNIAELFSPALLRTTIVTTILMACAYGSAFGAIQQAPQIVRAMPTVKEQKPPEQKTLAAETQGWQETGGLVGRFALAYLVIRIASQRLLLGLFVLPGLFIVPYVFCSLPQQGLNAFQVGMFAAGFFTVAQFSFFGNYLPRMYPLHLRGTGESFAANIGGRILGTSAALLTTQIQTYTNSLPYAAAGVAFTVFAVALVTLFFLPEPKEEDLPE
ncbi:MAG: MFS transporter [Planctomycetia bacterium]